MMKRLYFLFVFFMLLCLSAGLTGCIFDASPNPNETVYMEIGDTQVFTVKGTTGKNVYYQWMVKKGLNIDFQYRDQGESSSFEFTADPDNLSNNLTVTCRQMRETKSYLGAVVGITQDIKRWHIETPQTPPVWQGDYHIAKQSDIDFLVENGYEEISGSVVLQSVTVRSFDGLDCIKTIGGKLIISSVRNFSYFNGLTSVGGGVHIEHSKELKTIAGLDNLATIGGNLEISLNDRLVSIGGFNSLTSIGGDLVIWNNDAMTSIDGLSSLSSVGGNLEMLRNPELTEISGLNHVASVGGRLELSVSGSLAAVDNFQSITSVGGSLVVVYNDALESLDGFSNIATVGDGLYVGDNESLTGLGLGSLTSVAGDFTIETNIDLCTGLAEDLHDQVQAGGGIGGTVEIYGNKDCL